ncbi:hypothetical protein CXG81DRAFT_28013 [Caulochytrium protostelioides]|uniref:Class I SAM-dependent methyltransferase n=1 Tax=Caulochytrium protostelioides TaxID=1555241 RepID=A0A4P9X2T0_9FUNG|nr:hypothetical protein CXG81DRAFT_28013 [Caulochytrium protostelioides]|eukprot:RKO99210.1 hypothetical protein CXG81DRAFT_28013 [Caulochytrium protostelioides]
MPDTENLDLETPDEMHGSTMDRLYASKAGRVRQRKMGGEHGAAADGAPTRLASAAAAAAFRARHGGTDLMAVAEQPGAYQELRGPITKRLHWFEFHDITGVPLFLRSHTTRVLLSTWTEDFSQLPVLAPLLRMVGCLMAAPATLATDIIADVLHATQRTTVLDLCSGSGGAMPFVAQALAARRWMRSPAAAPGVQVIMSDYWPRPLEWADVVRRTPLPAGYALGYLPERMDALAASGDAAGVGGTDALLAKAMGIPPETWARRDDEVGGVAPLRTLLLSFHHFRDNEAARILRAAVAEDSPIAIFEFGHPHPLHLLSTVVVLPLYTMLVMLRYWYAIARRAVAASGLVGGLLGTALTPAFWRDMILTFVVPLIPMMLVWDGVVSGLRFHAPQEVSTWLHAMPEARRYHWTVGTKWIIPHAIAMSYIVGMPVEPGDGAPER